MLVSVAGATPPCAPPRNHAESRCYPIMPLMSTSRLRSRWICTCQGHRRHCHNVRCRRALGSQRACRCVLGVRASRPHRRLSVHILAERRCTATPYTWKWRLHCLLQDVGPDLLCCLYAQSAARSSRPHRQCRSRMHLKVAARLYLSPDRYGAEED